MVFSECSRKKYHPSIIESVNSTSIITSSAQLPLARSPSSPHVNPLPVFILESRSIFWPSNKWLPRPREGGCAGEGRAEGGGGCGGRLAELAAASETCKDNTKQLRALRFADHQQFLLATGGLQLPRQLPWRCYCFTFGQQEAARRSRGPG